MITTFQGRFIGIKLLRICNIQVELWFGMPRSNIPWHIHSTISSTIVHLFGDMMFRTHKWTKKFPYFSGFKWSVINKCELHKGKTGKYCAAFLNIEYWHSKEVMTSAAKDIILTNITLS